MVLEITPDIEIIIQDGEVTQVFFKDVEVRALVRNYDVEFPCVAHGLGQDEDGDYYMETIV